MPDADIPFPLSSAPGRAPNEGAGRLINCAAEALGQGAASPAVWRRVAGLVQFCAGTQSGCRGFLEVNGVLFAVIGQQLVYIDSGGTVNVVGVVAGTKRVTMARNNKKPTPDMVMVTENGAFVFTFTTITAYPDADLPVPNSVTFQDGYFFFPIADGRAFNSDLNDTAVNALGYTTAESKPDGLSRAIAWNNQLLLFGPYSLEFYVDNANPAPAFPYSRSTTISRGLAGQFAVAGHENGFGGAALIWVADDNTVVRLNGYGFEKISPPDLDRLIEAVSDKETLEAFVYAAGGHSKWVLSSPDWTWEFDLGSQKWNERESHGLSRWTATCSVFAFGIWLVGDANSAKVYQVDSTAHTENGTPLRMRIESGPVQNFPNRTRVPRADFDFANGEGDAAAATTPETSPVVEISYSDDGGSTWSLPLQRPLGPQGRFGQRVTVTRCGQTGPRGRRWRLDISDPVYAGLVRGVQATDMRRE